MKSKSYNDLWRLKWVQFLKWNNAPRNQPNSKQKSQKLVPIFEIFLNFNALKLTYAKIFFDSSENWESLSWNLLSIFIFLLFERLRVYFWMKIPMLIQLKWRVMLKANWRSFSEADLVKRLLTLFHLEEFEPTLLLLLKLAFSNKNIGGFQTSNIM